MNLLKYFYSYKKLEEKVKTREERISELEKELDSFETAAESLLRLPKVVETLGSADFALRFWEGERFRSRTFTRFVEKLTKQEEERKFEEKVRAIKCIKKIK